ncbi:hypothetical protein Ade02nite_55530 [Paractinoplanes deccanensis]|uniref:DUF2231 domain-containing protein n=1 Tax=Paractinoplanes deccanensis TaxID=113561 RepID=A0ABQ3YA78_9ACTN|nr:hypothetical protein [Actinoplanes deccanensis]GID76912.1 hypothetical protein Ade02nite_55530 [Actinoplanes deccanensis]
MNNATRALRWYAGVCVLFFGIVPAVLVSLLVARGNTPGSVGLLLIGGIPLVVAALVAVVRGIVEPDPELASRRLHLSMALVAGADVLLLGGNALIRMGSS